MLELSADGPMIRFNTDEDSHFDVRFASAMGYSAMSAYLTLYKRKMGII
jgi:hypothetical protein